MKTTTKAMATQDSRFSFQHSNFSLVGTAEG
jgi:hypothetical protein